MTFYFKNTKKDNILPEEDDEHYRKKTTFVDTARKIFF